MKEKAIWTLLTALSLFLAAFMILDANSEPEKNRRAQEEQARRTPHVIREADGCRVYAFEDGGHQHYFVRCGNDRTTTHRQYDDCRQSGKSSSCKKSFEVIEVAG
ncbi:hypothetical protein [Rivihabitans pingtungensis]|uniref:hypothetical protein n=1 Tax=Rivihabitans pingtungensis TaxID=1054498 RepID=UPI0011B815F0|nr:hypothetical protein [Rivihabitans pingtungensis]